MKILVTGGAGFIGSHLTSQLLQLGHDVRVYDNLEPQVHGEGQTVPQYLSEEIEFVLGDVRDRQSLQNALRGCEVVIHLASAVGVGQSMYEIYKYADVNTMGTATLLDIIVNEKTQVEKLMLSSSMSIFGEGTYNCDSCGVVYPSLRDVDRLKAQDWEMQCPSCQQPVTSIPTDESKPLLPTSVYATTKRDQEEMFCEIGSAYDIPTGVLRFFNVYGPRQALSNPYTGVIAIFANCILSGTPPVVFEDGLQTRDFTHVNDIVQANLLLLEKHNSGVEIYNAGTGVATSLLELLEALYEALLPGKPVEADVLGRYRAGDVRHCFADCSKLRNQLGYSPSMNLKDGIADLADWLKSQSSSSVVAGALSQLQQKGLVK